MATACHVTPTAPCAERGISFCGLKVCDRSYKRTFHAKSVLPWSQRYKKKKTLQIYRTNSKSPFSFKKLWRLTEARKSWLVSVTRKESLISWLQKKRTLFNSNSVVRLESTSTSLVISYKETDVYCWFFFGRFVLVFSSFVFWRPRLMRQSCSKHRFTFCSVLLLWTISVINIFFWEKKNCENRDVNSKQKKWKKKS